MKQLFVVASFLILATVAWPQQTQITQIKILTYPVQPPRETLSKMDLVLAWQTAIPVKGLRGGFFNLQLIPGKEFTLLLVQTLEGNVTALNAETGGTLWQHNLGMPFETIQAAAFNKQTIFVVRRDKVFALDRDTGEHQLFSVDAETNIKINGMQLDRSPSAGLGADDNNLFVCMGDRLQSYLVPNFRLAAKAKAGAETGAKLKESLPLIRTSGFDLVGETLLQKPIVYRDMVMVTTTQGTLVALDALGELPLEKKIIYSFKAGGPVDGAVGHNKGVIYLQSEDSFLYAIDIERRRVIWRSGEQSAIVQAPRVTDADVFVTPSRSGMRRVDRLTGGLRWANSAAVKFLAVNQRFVYAVDNVGNFLVLDYDRGKTMAIWDARDWVMPLSNEITDRIYLAAHDGQIVCLRYRDNVKPLTVKTFELPPPPPKKKIEKKLKDEEAPPKVDEPMPDKKDPDKNIDEPMPDKKEPDKKEPDKKDDNKNGKGQVGIRQVERVVWRAEDVELRAVIAPSRYWKRELWVETTVKTG
jgi:outer membrane protein assembly factor BamB